MIFIKSPVALLFSLVITMTTSSAAPIILNSVSERDVWVPKITSPTTGTVWTVGSPQTVTWDTSNRPGQVSNPTGMVVLGFLNADGSGGENLDIDHPLAQGFKLDDGSVQITVPATTKPNTNYIVALIGDSGNISPQFTISPSY